MEAVECWQIALATADRPVLLVLSRLPLETHRDYREDNPCRLGAYVLSEAGGPRQATIVATGSEVQIAMKAKAILGEKGVSVAVVSMPSWDLFDRQDKAYREKVLGTAPVFAVEAGAKLGWERYTRDSGNIVALETFGISAPPPQVYEELGLTPEKVAEKVMGKI